MMREYVNYSGGIWYSVNNHDKYQGVKEFHMLARIGCCNFMVFSPFKVNVTYYHPLNQWLLGATNGKPRTNSDAPSMF